MDSHTHTSKTAQSLTEPAGDTHTHTLLRQVLSELPEAGEAVCAELVKNAGEHLSELLGLSMASDGEGVCCQGCLHFGVVEVDYCPLGREHVYLHHSHQKS